MLYSSKVTLERHTAGKDAHGGRTDGPVAETLADVDATIYRPSNGNLYRINVFGDLGRLTEDPKAWKVTDDDGRVYSVFKATHRPPTPRVAESEHTTLFVEHVAEFSKESVI